MDRKFNGVFIPAKLYLDKNLNWVEKILIVEVYSLSDENEPCYASNEHFAEHLNLSKDRVSKIISKLVSMNYLKTHIVYKENSKKVDKRYLVVSDHTYSYFYLEGIVTNTDTPIGENNEENNKSILNTQFKEKEKYIKEKFEILFKKFWDAYPKRKNRGNAEDWFKKNMPSEELVNLMVAKINLLKLTADWKKDDGQYIPYPASWLNAKGWEDEIEVKDPFEGKTFLN